MALKLIARIVPGKAMKRTINSNAHTWLAAASSHGNTIKGR
jgi:hypothetical protein